MVHVGTGFIISGLVVAVTGIPLMVVGSHKVPRTLRDILNPTATIGPTNGSLTWRR